MGNVISGHVFANAPEAEYDQIGDHSTVYLMGQPSVSIGHVADHVLILGPCGMLTIGEVDDDTYICTTGQISIASQGPDCSITPFASPEQLAEWQAANVRPGNPRR